MSPFTMVLFSNLLDSCMYSTMCLKYVEPTHHFPPVEIEVVFQPTQFYISMIHSFLGCDDCLYNFLFLVCTDWANPDNLCSKQSKIYF